MDKTHMDEASAGKAVTDGTTSGLDKISSDEFWEWHTDETHMDEASAGEAVIDGTTSGLDKISSDEFWEWHACSDVERCCSYCCLFLLWSSLLFLICCGCRCCPYCSPHVHIRSRTVGEDTRPTLGFGHALIAWPKVSSLMVDANPSPEPLATLFGDLVSTR